MFSAYDGWISRKSPSSTTVSITRLMSYGLFGESGTSVSSSGDSRSTGSVGRGVRRRLEVVLWQEGEEVAGVLDARLLVRRDEVRHARLRRVGARAAELLEADVLARHGLHDVGPRDEHVRRPLGHQHEVRDRRRVDRAAGAGPHDQRDLRDDAGGLNVAPEDLRVARERDDALLDPRAAGVVDPDDGAADLDGHVHHLADLLGEDLGERAAEDGEVLTEHAHRPPEHGAVAGDDRVTPGPLVAHPELALAVADEPVELDERARIEQELDPLAGEQLAALVLPLDRVLGTRRARPRRSARGAMRASPPWSRVGSTSARSLT